MVSVLFAVSGCPRSPAPPTPSETTAVASTTAPTPSASSEDEGAGGAHAVVVVGVARDVKGGAAIVADDGTMTRIDGYDSWPSSLVDQRVVAEGRLEIRQGPACASDPVLPCQGIVGAYRVLVGAKVRRQ